MAEEISRTFNEFPSEKDLINRSLFKNRLLRVLRKKIANNIKLLLKLRITNHLKSTAAHIPKEIIKKISNNDNHWIREYVFWEMNLLSDIGYGLDLSECAVTSNLKDLSYVSPSSGRAVTEKGAGDYKSKLLPLPKFVTCYENNYSNSDIYNGLNLTEFFFKKRFFEPNNLNFPQSRNRLKEIFNK